MKTPKPCVVPRVQKSNGKQKGSPLAAALRIRVVMPAVSTKTDGEEGERWVVACLEEQLQELEDRAAGEDEAEDDYPHVLASFPSLPPEGRVGRTDPAL